MVLRKNNYNLTSTSKMGHIYKQISLTVISSFGGIIYGLQSGWLSPMQKKLQSDLSPIGRPLTGEEISYLAISTTVAGCLSGCIHMYTADTFGRKKGILLVLSMQMLSWLFLLKTSNIAVLIAARFFVGMGGAGVYIICPLYVKEISQDSIRGTLVTVNTVAQYIGIFAIYVMGSYLSYDTTTYICLFISIISMIPMALAPESPSFLVKVEKVEEATAILADLRGLNIEDEIVKEEMDKIKAQDLYFKTIPSLTFKIIYKNKAWRRGCIIGALMIICLNGNGVFTIVTFAHSILTQTGVSADAELLTLSVPIVMVLGSIVPITCVDRVGRKPILVGTYMLCSLSLIVLSLSLLMKNQGVIFPSSVPVIAMAVAVSSYSMGIMPMPFVIMSEMFRFQVRAKLFASILTLAWLMISIQLYLGDIISKAIGTYGLFFIFAGANFCGALLVSVFVPETKGKSPEEIEDILYTKKDNADSIS